MKFVFAVLDLSKVLKDRKTIMMPRKYCFLIDECNSMHQDAGRRLKLAGPVHHSGVDDYTRMKPSQPEQGCRTV